MAQVDYDCPEPSSKALRNGIEGGCSSACAVPSGCGSSHRCDSVENGRLWLKVNAVIFINHNHQYIYIYIAQNSTILNMGTPRSEGSLMLRNPHLNSRF